MKRIIIGSILAGFSFLLITFTYTDMALDVYYSFGAVEAVGIGLIIWGIISRRKAKREGDLNG